eukprot:TRINITY_DN2648_c0_g1_i2.p1 TRINITY_DN2648_c0_g1~~TRINITY_DN2648_c0_g1_i2.p1  ORF type:complete len:626 (+),score=142.75 TRINITY_DN2648_c0_g1_i2:324-2201(+)
MSSGSMSKAGQKAIPPPKTRKSVSPMPSSPISASVNQPKANLRKSSNDAHSPIHQSQHSHTSSTSSTAMDPLDLDGSHLSHAGEVGDENGHDNGVVGEAVELLQQLNQALHGDERDQTQPLDAARTNDKHRSSLAQIEVMRQELRQDISHSRQLIREELEWWGSRISKEARTVDDLKVVQSQFKLELQQHKERMMLEFSQLKGRIEDENKRAREAEEIVLKLKNEVDWLQGQLYHELRKIWDFIRSSNSAQRSGATSSTFAKSPASDSGPLSPTQDPSFPIPHSSFSNGSALGISTGVSPVIDEAVNPLEKQDLSVGAHQGTTQIVSTDTTSHLVPESLHDNTRIKKLLEESRQKLQGEIAVLKQKLQEESSRASSKPTPNRSQDQNGSSESLVDIALASPTADVSLEQEFGLMDADDSFMADIEDLRRRVELEDQLDASWQNPNSQTADASFTHQLSPYAWGSDNSDEEDVSSIDSDDSSSYTEETDEYTDVWDDEEYIYPLISFPVPIPDLLKKQPVKGVLKRTASVLTAPAHEVDTQRDGDASRKVNFNVGVKEYEIQDGLLQNLRPGRALLQYNSDVDDDSNPHASVDSLSAGSQAVGNPALDALAATSPRQFGLFRESPM